MSTGGAEFEGVLPPRLAGKYEVLACLKNGMHRQTYLISRTEDGSLFILKRDSEDLEDLAGEYKFLKQLRGEGIPEAVDCFTSDGPSDGASFLVREYISGQSLLDYMQKRGALPADEVVNITLSLCAIVKRLHSQTPPIIHRDIKAENIVRTDGGGIYLIDFGIARRYDPEIRQDTHVLGTPLYSPPEQYGYRQTDTRSDIYSIGVLMHELLTGESELGHGAGDSAIASVIDKCTRFDPADRYGSVDALERDLKALKSGRRRAVMRAVLIIAALVAAVSVAAVCAYAARSHAGTGGAGETSGTESAGGAATDAPTDAVTDGKTDAVTDPATDAVTDKVTDAVTDAATDTATDTAASTAPVGSGGIPDPSATHTFASPEIEAEVCRILGLQPGSVTYADLERVESLLLCGSKSFDNWDDISTHGESITIGTENIEENGSIDTLADIAYMPNLKTLAVCDQQISDISPLRGTGLQKLALHGNNITDVSPLAEVKGLFYLVISDNPIVDISPLAELNLGELDIGATDVFDMRPLTGMKMLYKLNLFECAPEADISPLKSIGSLNTLIISLATADHFSVIRQLSQLRYIYMWQIDGFTDYSQLDGLIHLEMLYVNTADLYTFDGLSLFDTLKYLDVRTYDSKTYDLLTVDLGPLTKFSALSELSIRGIYVDDWEPLLRMPALKKIYCTAEQSEEIKQVIGDRDIELAVF